MPTHFNKYLKSFFLTGVFLFSSTYLCHGTISKESNTAGDISLVKINSITDPLPKPQTLSLRNPFDMVKEETYFAFLPKNTVPASPENYNPFSALFFDFMQKKDDISFSILALQTPIYQTIFTNPTTQEEGKLSLYDISGKFYLLCEKPFDSQVLVELTSNSTLKPSDFHYLFRIDSICKGDKHLYIYLSEHGTEITFQREGDNVFYPLYQENLNELWLFFTIPDTSHKENTIDALKTDFLYQTDNHIEKVPPQTFSLEEDDKSFSEFQQSYLVEHNLGIPRENTDKFREEQERSALDQRHTNTVEISIKAQKERSLSAYKQDFLENTEAPDRNITSLEVHTSISFKDWKTAYSFYENILFQSLISEATNYDH